MSVTSITRAYNIMKLYQSAFADLNRSNFIILKGVAVRAFIMTARARFELTMSQSKCDVLPLH